MNDRNENKLSMYDTVSAYCDSKSSVIAGLPALVAAVSDFNNLLGGMHEALVLAETAITGYAQDKATKKGIMIKQCYAIGQAGMAYCTATNNSIAKAKFNYSISELDHMRDEDVDTVCIGIIETATNLGDALLDYGVTTAKLDDANTAIENYASVKQAPRGATVQRKTTNSTIQLIVDQIDIVLKDRMDPLVKTFQEDNPIFVEGYFNARIIIDRGHSTTEEEEEVTP